MKDSRTIEIPESWRVAVTLAQLLQRLETSAERSSADQYRSVVRHLSDELGRAEPGPELEALLNTFPAAAELYENLQYAQAGLCRRPLEASLNSELLARQWLGRLTRQTG